MRYWQHGHNNRPTEQQKVVPPEAASKLHLKDGDTFPDFKATDITTGATYDNTVFGQNKGHCSNSSGSMAVLRYSEMPMLQELVDTYMIKGVNVLVTPKPHTQTFMLRRKARIPSRSRALPTETSLLILSDGGHVIEGLAPNHYGY